MKPRTIEIDGTEYTCTPPTGADWLASADLPPAERSMELVARCVHVDGRPAFADAEAVARQPMALIMQLDRELGELLDYGISDPTSGASAP